MKIVKILVGALLFVSLAACDVSEPMQQQTSANGTTADLIAVVDGCNVWRINGEFHAVYMARCPEGAAPMQNTVTSGKTTRIQQTIAAP